MEQQQQAGRQGVVVTDEEELTLAPVDPRPPPPFSQVNQKENRLDMVLSTNNDSVIKTVLAFALDGGLFEGESLMVYPDAPTTSVRVPVAVPKNTAVELKLQVAVAARGASTQYHVFELTHKLPK